MRFREFDSDNLGVRLTGIIGQVHNRIRDAGYKKDFSVTSLLNILNSKDINIDRDEFINMLQDEPLKNMIANVKGDRVIFKGDLDSDSDAESPERSTSTLEKMAKRAVKK